MKAMAGTAPNPELVIPEHHLICRVCEKQYSKYTCPRCNMRYCSLPCYKRHSLRCTESFMCENVTEELRDIKATPESQKSMMEALKRIHFDKEGRSIFEDEFLTDVDAAEGDSEEDDAHNKHGKILSNRTLELIAEGGDISLDRLSLEEKKSFLRAVAAGEVSHLIQPWNPWWLNPLAGSIKVTQEGLGLVTPVVPSREQSKDESKSEELMEADGEVPAPPSNPLSKVKELLHGEPSPLLSIQLAELLYSYCFTLRFCNGDWQSEPLDSALILLSVSQVLDQAASPESVGIALAESMKTVCSPTFKHAGGFKFAVSLFDDTISVLHLGRPCVLCALADLYRMLEGAKIDLKIELRTAKQERSVRNDIPGLQSGNRQPMVDSDAYQNVASETDGQSNAFVELKKRRERKQQFSRKLNLPVRDKDHMRTVSPRKDDGKCSKELTFIGKSGSAAVRGKISNERKSILELKKLTSAVRKVYFLMCWTNEQSKDGLSSLASLITAEKDRFIEVGMENKSALRVVNNTKIPVKVDVPIIEEIVGTSLAKKTDASVQSDKVAPIRRGGPVIEELS